jgi:hypothetical protein
VAITFATRTVDGAVAALDDRFQGVGAVMAASDPRCQH